MKLVDVSPEANRRALIRLAKALGLLVLLLVLTGAVLTFMGGRQYEAELRKLKAAGEPYTLVDLAGPPVPDSENGAIIYEKIFRRLLGHGSLDVDAQGSPQHARDQRERYKVYDQLFDSEGSVTPEAELTQVDWAEARRVAAKYDWVLPLAEEATARPKCKFPVRWEDGSYALLPHLAVLRDLQHVLAVKAAVYAHDGLTVNAVRCVDLALRMTSAVETEPTIIAMLVRVSQINVACRGLRMVTREAALNPEQARAIYDVLASIDLNPHAILGIKGERGFGLLLFAQMRRQGITRNLCLLTSGSGDPRPEAWLLDGLWRAISYYDGAAYLRFMGKQVDNAGVPYRELDIDRQNYETSIMPKYWAFTRAIAPVFDRVRATRDKGMANAAIGQAAMALAAYKARFGSYPAVLANASNRLGWRIPDDPFSGKSLIYKRQGTGYLLYSIGSNLRDDGGAPRTKNDETVGDLVWKLVK